MLDWLHLRCVQRFDKSLMTGSAATMEWIDGEMTNLLYQLKAIYEVNMKSSRVAIILCYDERVEVEKGVWEKKTVEKKVKAKKEKIYQRRLDKAMADGQVLTARFSVRSNYVTDTLDYVKYNGKEYKVNIGTESDDGHYTIIELGELK